MGIVESLTEMGFPLVACKRAAGQTQGKGLEAATQWIMEHMDDPDFLSSPPELSGKTLKKNDSKIKAHIFSIQAILSQTKKALLCFSRWDLAVPNA